MHNDPKSSASDGIELLGTHYSQRLKLLYDRVQVAYGKPIRVQPTKGHVDNTIEPGAAEILIRLRPGSSEDNVAHELLHAVLESEGYPKIFSVRVLPLSQAIGNVIRADLDHLVINQRLQDLGYDPHAGFLKTADSYLNFLNLEQPSEPSQKAVFQIGAIHELMKFHFYVADPSSEAAILHKHPDLSPIWKDIKTAIARMPPHAKPLDVWHVAITLNAVFDRICRVSNASFRFSDLIGFDPIPLTSTELQRKAMRVFEETKENVPGVGALLRTFLRRDHMLASIHVVPAEFRVGWELDLPVSEFVLRREIHIMPAG